MLQSFHPIVIKHANTTNKLTNIDETNPLLLGDKVQAQLYILHLLCMDTWFLVVASELLL